MVWKEFLKLGRPFEAAVAIKDVTFCHVMMSYNASRNGGHKWQEPVTVSNWDKLPVSQSYAEIIYL